MAEWLSGCHLGVEALNLFIVQRELLGDEMPASGTSVALLMAYEKLGTTCLTSVERLGPVQRHCTHSFRHIPIYSIYIVCVLHPERQGL